MELVSCVARPVTSVLSSRENRSAIELKKTWSLYKSLIPTSSSFTLDSLKLAKCRVSTTLPVYATAVRTKPFSNSWMDDSRQVYRPRTLRYSLGPITSQLTSLLQLGRDRSSRCVDRTYCVRSIEERRLRHSSENMHVQWCTMHVQWSLTITKLTIANNPAWWTPEK